MAHRVRGELRALLDPSALDEAGRVTGLGLRSDRPRAYVAASLAGGTGSGAVVDLAYILRDELRRGGTAVPHVTGLLMLPYADTTTPAMLPLANARAALAELRHFGRPDTVFEARYSNREPAVKDAEAPFARTALLPAPRGGDAAALAAAADTAAALVVQEALSAVGKALDERLATRTGGSPYLSIGVRRLVFPRKRLLAAAAPRLAARLLASWTAKVGPERQEAVRQRIDEQWASRQLDPRALAASLETPAGAGADRPFTGLATKLDDLAKAAGDAMDASEACRRIDAILKLIGKPGKEEERIPGDLAAVFEKRGVAVATDAEGKLAALAVALIEEPGFRFGAAEEAIRFISERLRDHLADADREARGLEDQDFEDFVGLLPLISGLVPSSLGKSIGRRTAQTAELSDQMRTWSLRRYRLTVARAVANVYRGCSGTCRSSCAR